MVDFRDLMRLDGRVAIVTRGARGIGRETAETLAMVGARVVLADLDKEAAEGAAAEMRALGLHVTAIVADVADEASVDSMVQATLDREGRLDILVNNAGIAIRRPAVDLALGDWDKVLSVNMTGSFLCARRRPAVARAATGDEAGALQLDGDLAQRALVAVGRVAPEPAGQRHRLGAQLGEALAAAALAGRALLALAPGLELGDQPERLREFLRRVVEQEAEVRRMLRPDAAGLARWLATARFAA
jgi:NAD(P)-dependent dehydrogenase (short-subunit alcohol dehydrogenase family)